MFKTLLKRHQIKNLFLATLYSISFNATALVEVSVNPETALKGWKLSEEAFSLEIIQRLPDQTRAFFQGRGFSSDIANNIATQCVLQMIGKNISAQSRPYSITYDLHDWRIYSNAGTQRIKLKEDWDQQWSKKQVKPASRIAFRWATFPTQQDFEPGGDFNWGMISFGLPPGSIFDLKVVWKQDNNIKFQLIKQVECPADRS